MLNIITCFFLYIAIHVFLKTTMEPETQNEVDENEM